MFRAIDPREMNPAETRRTSATLPREEGQELCPVAYKLYTLATALKERLSKFNTLLRAGPIRLTDTTVQPSTTLSNEFSNSFRLQKKGVLIFEPLSCRDGLTTSVSPLAAFTYVSRHWAPALATNSKHRIRSSARYWIFPNQYTFLKLRTLKERTMF